MKILPPPHNKGQQTATGSGEIISSTGGLIQSVNILPETGKPAELHKVPGSVVTSSVRILPLSAPATSAADAGNTVALISAEGPPKPLVSSQAATFTTNPLGNSTHCVRITAIICWTFIFLRADRETQRRLT